MENVRRTMAETLTVLELSNHCYGTNVDGDMAANQVSQQAKH
jgi:hypothetical protein